MTRFFILTLMLLQNLLIAQRHLPAPEDVALAEEMRKAYPDEKVASINHLTDVTFDYDKKEDLVTVTVKTK